MADLARREARRDGPRITRLAAEAEAAEQKWDGLRARREGARQKKGGLVLHRLRVSRASQTASQSVSQSVISQSVK